MNRNSYFDNLDRAVIENNAKALAYGDGRAWDNKKRKTVKSHMPRGKAYRRLCSMKWRATCDGLSEAMNAIVKALSQAKERGE